MRPVLFRFEPIAFWLIDQRKLPFEEVWAPATLHGGLPDAPVGRSNAG